MANVFDYVEWRGDLSLKQDEFNEIDSLILSRFSYFPFDDIMKENEVVTIKELSERFAKRDRSKMAILWEYDPDFFIAMGKSKRFGEMKATKYINKINEEEEKQFSAITILLPDDTIYVSYRGTDNTIVGWKEDFNMSFKSHLPAQKDAVKYLDEVAKKYHKKIRIGGHSKGGNIAVYAGIYASYWVKKRILSISNNDGPGFNDEITMSKEYKQMIDKVNTYIPQESIFGRLLNHKEKYTVIKSVEKGVMQHDLYSWQISGKNFVCVKEVTDGSKYIDKSIRDWLEQIDVKQREQVIDIIFEIIDSTKAKTLEELKIDKISTLSKMLQSYKQVSPEDRKMITKTLSALIKISTDNMIELNKNAKK